MVLSKGVLENQYRIQHKVARYILQLPKSSARVEGAGDARFMQMKDMVGIGTRMFVWNIQTKKHNKIFKALRWGVTG